MFKITTTPSYFTPVTVELPGSKTKNVFDAEFVRLPKADIDALLERVNQGEVDDAAFAREIMIGWKGVSDEDGDLEFSTSNLDTLLGIYPVARTIVEAYFASLSGSRLKN